MEDFYVYIIIGFIVTIIIFLILREVVCWYYKINESLTLQIRVNELLSELIEIKKSQKVSNSSNTIEEANFNTNDSSDLTEDNLIGKKYSDGIIINLNKEQKTMLICSIQTKNAKRDWEDTIKVLKQTEWRLPTKYEYEEIYDFNQKLNKLEIKSEQKLTSETVNSNECYVFDFNSKENTLKSTKEQFGYLKVKTLPLP